MTPDRADHPQVPPAASYNLLTIDRTKVSTKDLGDLKKDTRNVNEFLANWGMKIYLQGKDHYKKKDVRIILEKTGKEGGIVVPISKLMGDKKGREKFLEDYYNRLCEHILHENWEGVTRTTTTIMTALDINPILRGKVPGIFAARMENAKVRNSLDRLAETCVETFEKRIRNVHVSLEFAGIEEMAIFLPRFYKELGNLAEISGRWIYGKIRAPNQFYGM